MLDEKSAWLFREKLTKEDVVEELFSMFHNHLNSKGLIVNEGKMVDASFTTAPRQRNTPDENKKIKAGERDDLWNDKPHKKGHKDVDDRWTKKGGDTFYGYKNHAKVDTKSKLIDYYVVTDASVHDSQPLMLVDRWIEFAQRVWILELFDLTLRSDRRFSLGRYGFLS